MSEENEQLDQVLKEVRAVREILEGLMQPLVMVEPLALEPVALEKLRRIRQWCDAYPLEVFPEPDFRKARALLSAGGVTIDAISASNMRHVLDGIREIIDGDGG